MMKNIRSHLAWKVFLSYVAVVLVGVIVLFTATSLSAPAAFDRHMAGMSQMMSGNNMNMAPAPMAGVGSTQPFENELFTSYQASVLESLSLAAAAALVAAVVASYLISRLVVNPVQRMMLMSQRIAEGEYKERINLTSQVQSDQMDELDQLAISFNQMADKLEKTETMRRQLIGDVSHELRTPLAAIKGYMEGLMDGVLPADPETYQQVHAEAERLQRLVSDLQELSRVDSETYSLKLEPIPVTILIDTVTTHLSRQFEDKSITLDKEIEKDLTPVLADKDRIVQVLTNLLGNALQYTPEGGHISIRTTRKNHEVVISITDSGIGISPDHLPFIFNRFYRTDKSRARASGGSGIGLTIAQAIVKSHHGRIWAESHGEGKGSSFSFTLPESKQY